MTYFCFIKFCFLQLFNLFIPFFRFARWLSYLDRPTPVYSFVTPLRVLINLIFKPEIYRDLLQIHRLEHHCEQRKKDDPTSWKFHQNFVVNRIKTLRPQLITTLGANLKGEQEMVLDDLDNIVHEVVCRLRTNTLQLNTDNSQLIAAMGLYPIYSLLNHSCTANTTTSKSSARQGFRQAFCFKILSIFNLSVLKF